jgi:hypothetical protein
MTLTPQMVPIIRHMVTPFLHYGDHQGMAEYGDVVSMPVVSASLSTRWKAPVPPFDVESPTGGGSLFAQAVEKKR